MPLLITDDSGNLLYKSRAFKTDAAAFAALISKEELGLVQSGKLRMYVREVTLGGKRYRFYLDFDRLTECYGVSAARTAADGLFDMEALASAPKVSVTLKHWRIGLPKATVKTCAARASGWKCTEWRGPSR